MIKTVKQACKFNPAIRGYQMAEGIENLADLIKDEGDGRDFFARNFVTNGMEQLFREAMLRLSSKSDQPVFELTQAMGGGKTHMMIALGLLARHPHLRPEVLPADLNDRLDFKEARIAAFSGRDNPDHFIWGEIATQIGAEKEMQSHWKNGPKSVDQQKWKEIIGDTPTLILLDELPPYLSNAVTMPVGRGTLADMVVYSLGTLMSAAMELRNCVVVIANLSGSYKSQTKALKDEIDNLQQEVRRGAMTITPVQLAGNEIYEILKKRLIDQLPDEGTIGEIAEEYAQQVKKAEASGYIVASNIEQIAEQARQTYPFHPSFKHLVALFKENEGFRQTRGLMQFTARLLKCVEQRETDDIFLVGTQHLDLNDDEVRDEIQRIAPNLMPAVSHDIADHGDSVAENLDDGLGADAARQVMTLLLSSSLSRAVGGRIGLSEGEIIEFLAAPNRTPDEFRDAIDRLREQAWYLHREETRLFVKETENLSRQIERTARDLQQSKVDSALINHLQGILQPSSKRAYQILQVLPKLDDLSLGGSRVLIVIRPDGKVPPEELQKFFDYQQEKNNLLVLTGQDSQFADAVEERLRELYAIEQIEKRLKPGDTLYEEARDRREDAQDRFHKALSAGYNRLYYPAISGTDTKDRLMAVTIDNGLIIGANNNSAETQIEQLLASPRANYKLVLDMADNYNNYFSMAEEYLWPSGKDNRRVPWRDIVSRARSLAAWPWMPGTNGMEALKTEALKQKRWRVGQEDGYIEKGPFPAEKTTANVSLLNSNAETGESILSVTPRNAGDSPIVHYSTKSEVTATDPQVDDLDNFSTKAGSLYFLIRTESAKYEVGPPVRWVADLRIQHQVKTVAGKRHISLQATPRADITYSLDGSNPKDGTTYDKPFEIGPEATLVLVHASADEASKRAEFQIPASGNKQVPIDDKLPARLQKPVTLGTTDRVYAVINKFRDKPNTTFKGVRIEIGEGENIVSVRFQERAITAAMIEEIATSLRSALGDDQAELAVSIREISFESGYDAKEFAKVAEVELKPGEVIQGDQ